MTSAWVVAPGCPGSASGTLRAVFKTEPLGAAELALALGAAGVVFVAVEIEKWTIRRRDHRDRGGIDA